MKLRVLLLVLPLSVQGYSALAQRASVPSGRPAGAPAVVSLGGVIGAEIGRALDSSASAERSAFAGRQIDYALRGESSARVFAAPVEAPERGARVATAQGDWRAVGAYASPVSRFSAPAPEAPAPAPAKESKPMSNLEAALALLTLLAVGALSAYMLYEFARMLAEMMTSAAYSGGADFDDLFGR